MAKIGRPTNYRPEYADRVIELGTLGWSKAMIAAEIAGGSYEQIDRWEKANPPFREAMVRARQLALAWFEQAGQRGIDSRDFNSNLYRIVMAGRFPAEYRDSKIVEHIQAPADLDLGKLTPEERTGLATLLGKAKRTPEAAEAESLPVSPPSSPGSEPKPLADSLN